MAFLFILAYHKMPVDVHHYKKSVRPPHHSPKSHEMSQARAHNDDIDAWWCHRPPWEKMPWEAWGT